MLVAVAVVAVELRLCRKHLARTHYDTETDKHYSQYDTDFHRGRHPERKEKEVPAWCRYGAVWLRTFVRTRTT